MTEAEEKGWNTGGRVLGRDYSDPEDESGRAEDQPQAGHDGRARAS